MEPKLEWGNERGRETLFFASIKANKAFFPPRTNMGKRDRFLFYFFKSPDSVSPGPPLSQDVGRKSLGNCHRDGEALWTLKNCFIESLIRREVIGSVKLFFKLGLPALLLLRGQDEGQDQVRGTTGGFAKQHQEGGRSGGGEGKEPETWDRLISFWQTICENKHLFFKKIAVFSLFNIVQFQNDPCQSTETITGWE